MHLVGGHDRQVMDWASQVLDKRFVEPATAFGVVNDEGRLHGAAIFNDFYPGGNLELTYLGPHTLSRKIIRGIALYAFKECGVARLTCKTERRNRIVQKLLPRLGFTLEYSQKRYFGPEKAQDALVFVLYRNHAPSWLFAGG